MAQLLCQISEGLRPAEANVRIEEYNGIPHYLPAHRDFLTREGGNYYLPVTLLWIDEAKKVALVGLSIETDSGANRLWVKLDQLMHTNGVVR